MAPKQNKILIAIDGSYFLYYVMFGAISQFYKLFPLEAKTRLKSAEETDQTNIPNILTSDNFKIILKRMTMKRVSVIDWILRQNFADFLDIATSIDTVFAMDDNISKSFRKKISPEYKAQRSFVNKQFQIQPVKDYIVNVIFKELDLEQKYNYKIVKVANAEGDDVIACLMQNFTDYVKRILFASDKDFLQLKDVSQFDLRGKPVVRESWAADLDPAKFLLLKIIVGDPADNIQQVFHKVGLKKALKLVLDRESLKTKLLEEANSAKQFLLNKKLISFDEIPQDLNDTIVETINEKVFTFNAVGAGADLGVIDLMEL